MISGWWFHPIPKILVRLDHHPQYIGKEKMFQTPNQFENLFMNAVDNYSSTIRASAPSRDHPQIPVLGKEPLLRQAAVLGTGQPGT